MGSTCLLVFEFTDSINPHSVYLISHLWSRSSIFSLKVLALIIRRQNCLKLRAKLELLYLTFLVLSTAFGSRIMGKVRHP